MSLCCYPGNFSTLSMPFSCPGLVCVTYFTCTSQSLYHLNRQSDHNLLKNLFIRVMKPQNRVLLCLLSSLSSSLVIVCLHFSFIHPSMKQ